MKPVYEAKKLALELGVCFEKELVTHLSHGIVVSLPDRFIMARPIQLSLGDEVLDPPQPDCWLITCAIGKKCLLWFNDQLPMKLPYMAWRRHNDKSNRFRCYNVRSLERLARINCI